MMTADEGLKAQLKETLRELTALDGVAGQETAVVRWLRDRFTPPSDHFTGERMGYGGATKPGTTGGPALGRVGHSVVNGAAVNGGAAGGENWR